MSWDPNKQGYPYILFAWVIFAVTSFFIPVRLYVQLRHYTRPWRELWVLLAWLLFLIYNITNSAINDYDWYYTGIEYSPEQLVMIQRWSRVGLYVYLQCLYACKAALLCLYSDLVPRRTKMWWAIVATGVCVAIASTNDLALNVFASIVPFKRRAPWKWVHRWGDSTYWLHLATDVQVFILPFPILSSLRNITRGQKIGAYALFTLGFINIGNALLMVLAYRIFIEWNDPSLNFLASVQPATGIMLICLPYCRRLWVDIRTYRRRNSAASSAADSRKPSYPDTICTKEAQVQVAYLGDQDSAMV